MVNVCFLLGNFPASEFLCQIFGTRCLFHLRRWYTTYEVVKKCSETLTHKIQTPGNCPEESVQHSEQGESLKSRKMHTFQINVLIQLLMPSTCLEHHVFIIGKTICTCSFFITSLISNFRPDLNIVYVLLGISPASNCSWPTFRNPVSVPSSKAGCRVYILYIGIYIIFLLYVLHAFM